MKEVNAAGPNSAVIFWPRLHLSGLERLAFYNEEALITSVSAGQATVIPLAPGQNEFTMSWQEVNALPANTQVYLTADPARATYYVVVEIERVVWSQRRLENVSKAEMFQEIEKAYR